MSSFSIFSSFTISENFIGELSVAIEILKTYNCRANEVLQAKWKDFHRGKFLILNGSKKSSNVVIRDKFILSLIENLSHTDSENIFPSISYSKLYNHCKTYYSHLFVKFKKRKNFKVTHGWRYLNVSELDNEQKIRDVLHHRSVISGKYYKQLKKESNNGRNS